MKPDYYEDFTCIADRCSFTCCREWKIGVDEDTFAKWKHTLTPDGMYDTDRGQQAKKEKLSGYVRKKDGSREKLSISEWQKIVQIGSYLWG